MTETKKPSLLIAFIPVIFLIGILMLNVKLYGDATLDGSNQMTLLFSGTVAAILGLTYGVKWKKIMDGVTKSIGSALSALIILLLIGSLAGTWILSGIVPAMIYYGLDILSPSIFLFATCIICIIVSLATGSSWTTVATVGIALIGIGKFLGLSEAVVAGAIISGAYFGDKMSPLSDTTNLAPAMAGTDLFTHIRYMMWTTIPSITIALIIFLIMGFAGAGDAEVTGVAELQEAIASKFYINPVLFLVPVGVIFMIVKKVPAIPALLAGAILGGVFAIIFQPDLIKEVGAGTDIEVVTNQEHLTYSWSNDSEGSAANFTLPGEHTLTVTDTVTNASATAKVIVPPYSENAQNVTTELTINNVPTTIELNMSRGSFGVAAYMSVINAMTIDMAYTTGNDKVDELLGTSGMSGMLGTIWLIVCAMSFGGIMEATGMLQRIAASILSMAKSVGALVATTTGTCIFFNVTASDQYLSLVVPGRMFANEYKERGLQPQLLSRTLEDSGTVTSALVPWNTCGAYHAGVLGVATGEYFMYAFFNLISPIMTMIFGFMGWGIAKPGEAIETPAEVE